MCGIAGHIVQRGQPDKTAVLRIAERLHHRGPDGTGWWSEGPAFLAATRLKIVNRPDKPGGQPAMSADGRFVLVWNGEIYNWRELASQLHLETTTDTELLVEWLAAKGIPGLSELRGMFALFLWDRWAREGWLARDAIGVKPLIIRREGDNTWFASESAALLRQRPRPPVPERLAASFVLPAFSGDQPLHDGLEALPAGSVMHLPSQRMESWYQPSRASGDLKAAVTDALTEVGSWHLPRALLLSGGLDSSLIAAVSRPERSLVLRWEDQTDFAGSPIITEDDGPWAMELASHLGLHAEEVLVAHASVPERLDRIARSDSHLPAWEQQLSQDALFEAAAARDLRVVLVGDAADELWAGYPFLYTTPVADLFQTTRRVGLLTPTLRAAGAAAMDKLGKQDPPAINRAVRKYWLPRLLHNGDLHAMAWSVENRVPFADPRLLAISWGSAPTWPVDKLALRSLDLLPDRWRNRPKSALPQNQAAGPVYRSLLKDRLRRQELSGWLDPDALRQLVSGEGPTDAATRTLLFGCAALEAWAGWWGARS